MSSVVRPNMVATQVAMHPAFALIHSLAKLPLEASSFFKFKTDFEAVLRSEGILHLFTHEPKKIVIPSDNAANFDDRSKQAADQDKKIGLSWLILLHISDGHPSNAEVKHQASSSSGSPKKAYDDILNYYKASNRNKAENNLLDELHAIKLTNSGNISHDVTHVITAMQTIINVANNYAPPITFSDATLTRIFLEKLKFEQFRPMLLQLDTSRLSFHDLSSKFLTLVKRDIFNSEVTLESKSALPTTSTMSSNAVSSLPTISLSTPAESATTLAAMTSPGTSVAKPFNRVKFAKSEGRMSNSLYQRSAHKRNYQFQPYSRTDHRQWQNSNFNKRHFNQQRYSGPPLFNPQTQQRGSNNFSNNRERSTSNSGNFHCSYHGINSTHSTQQCRVLQRVSSMGANAVRNANALIACNNDFFGNVTNTNYYCPGILLHSSHNINTYSTENFIIEAEPTTTSAITAIYSLNSAQQIYQ